MDHNDPICPSCNKSVVEGLDVRDERWPDFHRKCAAIERAGMDYEFRQEAAEAARRGDDLP